MKKLLICGLVALGSMAAADSLVLQPAAEGIDAMVASNQVSTNFATYAYLMVNYGSTTEVRAVLFFDLSSIAGATVTAATLDIGIALPNSTNYNFGIYRCTDAWTETAVNWSNQPAIFATAADIQMVGGGANTHVVWTLTTLVQSWVNGTYTNNGMMLKRVDMNSPTAWPYFASSDNGTAALRPMLSITYTPNSSVTPTSLGRVKAIYN